MVQSISDPTLTTTPNSQRYLRYQVAAKVAKLRKTPPVDVTKIINEQLISTLFELGGIISGGAAVALIHERPIKDLDFYFNDEQAYLEAVSLTRGNPKFDICWYFNQPHELHDIGFVMCNVWKDKIVVTDPAQEAIQSQISKIFIENVIYPDRTAKRLLKYNTRYGMKFHRSEVLALAAIYKLDAELVKQLLAISV